MNATVRCPRCRDSGLVVTAVPDPENGPAFDRYHEAPCSCVLGMEVERELEKLAGESGRIVDDDPPALDDDADRDNPFRAFEDDDDAPDGKPACQLTGEDGNAFAVIGRVSAALTDTGLGDQAAEFRARAVASGSYDALLNLCRAYVDAR